MIYSFKGKPTSSEMIFIGQSEIELRVEYRSWHHYSWSAIQPGAHWSTRGLGPTKDAAVGDWVVNNYSTEDI